MLFSTAVLLTSPWAKRGKLEIGADSIVVLARHKASMEKQLKLLEKDMFRDESIQGIYYPSDALFTQFSGTYGILGSAKPLTENQMDKFAGLMSLADAAIVRISAFMEGEWAAYREAVLQEEISILKD